MLRAVAVGKRRRLLGRKLPTAALAVHTFSGAADTLATVLDSVSKSLSQLVFVFLLALRAACYIKCRAKGECAKCQWCKFTGLFYGMGAVAQKTTGRDAIPSRRFLKDGMGRDPVLPKTDEMGREHFPSPKKPTGRDGTGVASREVPEPP